MLGHHFQVLVFKRLLLLRVGFGEKLVGLVVHRRFMRLPILEMSLQLRGSHAAGHDGGVACSALQMMLKVSGWIKR